MNTKSSTCPSGAPRLSPVGRQLCVSQHVNQCTTINNSMILYVCTLHVMFLITQCEQKVHATPIYVQSNSVITLSKGPNIQVSREECARLRENVPLVKIN